MIRNSCVDIIRESDKDELFAIRAHAYSRQYGENVDTSILKWNSWDEKFLNIGVFDQGNLISTLRISFVGSLTDYQKIMLCDLDTVSKDLPIVILSRAATKQGYESLGLHSLLRYHALQMAKQVGVNWVQGTFKKDVKRVEQLKEMGYAFSENPIPWQSFLKSNEPTFVVSLDLKNNYIQATQRLLATASDLIQKYPASWGAEIPCLKTRVELAKNRTVVRGADLTQAVIQ